MLACAQDLFFQPPTNSSTKDERHHHPPPPFMNKEAKRQHQLQQQLDHLSTKEKEEQQVWPPDVEGAFIKALETIPKLGRRKILVNGKPCGRNELISDFIFRKTGKIRTRKQVSSHIQVLKNTRKGDPHFMRLLTDSAETADEGYVSTNTTNTTNTLIDNMKKPKGIRRTNKKSMAKYHNTAAAKPSCSPSPPIDYSVFDLIYQQSTAIVDHHATTTPFYDPFLNTTSTADVGNGMTTSSTCSFSSSTISPISATTLLNEDDLLLQQLFQQQESMNLISSMMNNTADTTDYLITTTTKQQQKLWPNYICLYLEYTLPYDPSIILPHTLANLPTCHPNQLPTIHITPLIAKCPLLSDFPNTIILSAQVGLNLNLTMTDFYFNNTSFFETQDRRTINCTTTIYSFGNIVLESKETQQALWINADKYMYSFVYVNQFFDAFIKGIRSLQSWQEVDIAINNLCVVQVFHDVEAGEPLLVMMYEFERGDGTMEVSMVEQKVKQVVEQEVSPAAAVVVVEEFDFLTTTDSNTTVDAVIEL